MNWYSDIQFYLGDSDEARRFVYLADTKITDFYRFLCLLVYHFGLNPESVNKYLSKQFERAAEELKPKKSDNSSAASLFEGLPEGDLP